MLQRKPELREHMTQLQSGIGMPGGPENPISSDTATGSHYQASGGADVIASQQR
jgi:hypothetical protein